LVYLRRLQSFGHSEHSIKCTGKNLLITFDGLRRGIWALPNLHCLLRLRRGDGDRERDGSDWIGELRSNNSRRQGHNYCTRSSGGGRDLLYFTSLRLRWWWR
jgi:hypothetical protein